jgi:hypothetical protein
MYWEQAKEFFLVLGNAQRDNYDSGVEEPDNKSIRVKAVMERVLHHYDRMRLVMGKKSVIDLYRAVSMLIYDGENCSTFRTWILIARNILTLIARFEIKESETIGDVLGKTDGVTTRKEKWLIDESVKAADIFETLLKHVDKDVFRKERNGLALKEAVLELVSVLMCGKQRNIKSNIPNIEKNIAKVLDSYRFLSLEMAEYDPSLLVLCMDIRAFCWTIEHGKKNYEKARRIALSEVLFSVKSRKALEDRYQIEVCEQMLNIEDSNRQVQAFRELLHVAYKCGEFQLAYDAGYTFVFQRIVGIVEEKKLLVIPVVKPKNEIAGVMADASGELTPFYVGNAGTRDIKRLFSNTCQRIGNFFEPGSYPYEVFYKMSQKPYKDIDNLESLLRFAEAKYGLIMGNAVQGRIDRAIEGAEEVIDIITTHGLKENYDLHERRSQYDLSMLLRYSCSLALILLFCKEKGDYGKWKDNERVQLIVSETNQCLRRFKYETYQLLSDETAVEEPVKLPIGDELDTKNLQDAYDNVGNVLYLIRGLSQLTLHSLRRYQYNSDTSFSTREAKIDEILKKRLGSLKSQEAIAYYTTLKNASYLFDEKKMKKVGEAPVEVSEGEAGNNCFTVMNERYMNDPLEGVALIRAMRAKHLFCEDKEEYHREAILSKNHLFLKSFTNQIDELLMWNRYASDYDSAGRNSNGCCIVFSGDTFERVLHFSDRNLRINYYDEGRIASIKDDYHLYRVIYLTDDGLALRTENKGVRNSSLTYFTCLQKCFERLDSMVEEYNLADSTQEIVNRIMCTEFRSLMFLAKDKAYSDEHESRMVIWRELDDKDVLILGNEHMSTPPKLAVIPFFQVYIERIIFGPNTRNIEEWKPYLQTKLKKMWNKHPGKANSFTIQNSEIPYSTS